MIAVIVMVAVVIALVKLLAPQSTGTTEKLHLPGVSVPGTMIYQNPDVSGMNGVTLAQDGSVVAVGSTGVYSWGSPPKQWRGSGLMVRFNTDLSTLALSFKSNSTEILNSVALTASGDLVVAGTIQDSTGIDNSALLAMIDSSGNLLWQRQYGNDNFRAFHKVIVVGDGSFVVIATDQKTKQDEVVKLSNTGDIDWSQAFGYRTIQDIITTIDNNVVVVGSKLIGQNDCRVYCSWLVKTSLDADTLWSVDLRSLESSISSRAYNMVVSSALVSDGSGSIYVVGTDSLIAFTAKFDADGILSWAKQFPCPSDEEKSMCSLKLTGLTPNGSLITAGTMIKLDDPGLSGQLNSHQILLVSSLSRDGDLQWQQIFDDGGYCYPNGLIVAADGTTTVVGDWQMGTGVKPLSGLVVRLTADGKIH